ncbi:MAG: glycosyltransferase [Bacteroidales bacterium]|nr:glycosyltransferase [Bacteroidales bacterium]
MKNLLQIGIEVNSGSTGRIAEQIGIVALNNGWQSYITFARGFNPGKSNTIKIGNKVNIYAHVLQTRLWGNHLKASTQATKRLIREISLIKPDIIQLHQLHGYYLNLEVLFNYLANIHIPVVWTLHDCWAFTGHCAYFSLLNCNKWQSECFDCPQIHKYPKSYVDKSKENFYLKEKLFNSLPNLTIVTVSDWLNGLVKQSFLKKHHVQTIQNGVDITKFYPHKDTDYLRKKYSIPNKTLVMGVGTIWSESKGLYDYIKLRDLLDQNVSIVLVGLTKKQIDKLPQGIIGIERTESIDELAQLYSLADIVLSLSYQEAFGLTPIEGFACETPTIVYNNTALPELITSKVGIITETGNLKQVNDAIMEIIKKGKNQYSTSCIARASKVFDINVKYQQYFALYEKLLAQKV